VGHLGFSGLDVQRLSGLFATQAPSALTGSTPPNWRG
jgi:hypothetical protein